MNTIKFLLLKEAAKEKRQSKFQQMQNNKQSKFQQMQNNKQSKFQQMQNNRLPNKYEQIELNRQFGKPKVAVKGEDILNLLYYLHDNNAGAPDFASYSSAEELSKNTNSNGNNNSGNNGGNEPKPEPEVKTNPVEESFLKKHWGKIGIGAGALGALGYGAYRYKQNKDNKR